MPLLYEPDHAKKVTGQVQCPRCEWRAKLTSDTKEEVEDFLGRLVVSHVSAKHPQ